MLRMQDSLLLQDSAPSHRHLAYKPECSSVVVNTILVLNFLPRFIVFAVNAVKQTRRLPGLLYTIRLLEIHQDDALALERDIDHPCRAVVSEGGVTSPSFVLPNGTSL